MFEQDYIKRLIKEMVRVILKLLFDIDTDSPTAEMLEDSEEKETLKTLLDMAENGRINEAENKIYEITEDLNKNHLEVALIFYSYLNELPTEFLEDNHFSRDEVKQGLQTIISKYGLEGITEIFIQ